MGSKGGGGDTTTIVHYPDYLEWHHHNYLDIFWWHFQDKYAEEEPFGSLDEIDLETAFFASGFELSSFPSLYDMFGKFVAGLDVDVLFTQILDDSINNTAIDDRVAAHGVQLSDDIDENAFPRFATGMRDINSVMSSTFIVGKAMLETARTKALSLYDAELRVRMLPVAVQRWQSHLSWNQDVPKSYAELLKFYIVAKTDINEKNLEWNAKNTLWVFTLLDYYRSAVGSLTGASTTVTDVKGASKSGSILAGILGGAASGAAGGAPGALLGAAIGGLGAAF